MIHMTNSTSSKGELFYLRAWTLIWRQWGEGFLEQLTGHFCSLLNACVQSEFVLKPLFKFPAKVELSGDFKGSLELSQYIFLSP